MTNRAKTLLEYASIFHEEVNLETAALVLIDYQNEYVTGTLVLEGVKPALQQAKLILEAFRTAGAPVFHVVQHSRPDGALFDPKTRNVEIHEAVTPLETEPVIIKGLPNAFSSKDFTDRIADCGRKNLIVIGFMTHMCVSSTARYAAEHGFRVTIVANACATRDLPNPLHKNENIPANVVHVGALAALSDRFANVITQF